MLMALFAILLLAVSGCDVLEGIAPSPEPTTVPTETITPPTETPEPTMGPPEFIDAAYCWESHIDEAEFNLIRFFPNGTLIDVFVQPYPDCQTAWEKTEKYLVPESLEQFSHGEYHLSGERIKFTLIPAYQEEVVGEVNGKYLVDKMLLIRQGSDEWEYKIVWEVNP
jgi:hypothetical protein